MCCVTMEGNGTMAIMPPKRDPLYIVLPITVIYSVILLGGIVGNVITCVVIARNKYMHTATNYYLFSLAVSDLVLLITGLPQEMVAIWCRYPYLFGEAFCVIRGFAAEMSSNATVLTIAAFTSERYIAICHPLKSHTMSKLSRVVKIILAAWTLSVLLAIPHALQLGIVMIGLGDVTYTVCSVKRVLVRHAFEISTFVFFVAPMTLITVLYVLIALKLRRSKVTSKTTAVARRIKDHNSCVPVHSPYGSSSRRVVRMLVAVVVAFFVCWAPFHAQRLLAIYGTGGQQGPSPTVLIIYDILTYVSGILYYVSTSINPILYNIMSRKFRQAFKDNLSGCFCLRDSPARRDLSEPSRSHLHSVPDNNSRGDEDESLEDPEARLQEQLTTQPEDRQSSLINDTREKGPKFIQKIRVLYGKKRGADNNAGGIEPVQWGTQCDPTGNGRLELCTFVAGD